MQLSSSIASVHGIQTPAAQKNRMLLRGKGLPGTSKDRIMCNSHSIANCGLKCRLWTAWIRFLYSNMIECVSCSQILTHATSIYIISRSSGSQVKSNTEFSGDEIVHGLSLCSGVGYERAHWGTLFGKQRTTLEQNILARLIILFWKKWTRCWKAWTALQCFPGCISSGMEDTGENNLDCRSPLKHSTAEAQC